ncbi:Pentatricopeptide repeat-containing protein [Heracleum sosnowskyi]|uniref:Pentatricopeptide repeat-containing protein n=1 Tax=Heracleum sosnowskyi TaxID=360622 RepID=A0AAD8IHU4_9APIA|nr:Pentatricopeptide repeat-containing protein [Heracleum sosnowskyi]
MTLISVSSRLLSFLRRRRIGTSSCFQSLSIGVVHFHVNDNIAKPNSIPHSTHSIPSPHIKLQQYLVQKSKSGFDNLDDALAVFDKMLKLRPLPYDFHFNQLFTALVKMKQYQVAVSLFQEMSSRKIDVDIITFNIAINCCCHSNRVDYAFSLLLSAFKRGFVPDVFTYTTLIRGHLSQHKSAEARLFFTNLIKLNELQPDVVTDNTVINGLCKTGHTQMAIWLFRFMEKSDCKPNTVTYNTVIDSLCQHGLVDDALILQSEMMEKGILPNVWTYSPLIQVLCKLNRWEELSLLLQQMIEDMNISPNVHTFTILVDAYAKSGKLDDAKQIIKIMNERGEYPNIVTYNSLMQAYCSQGQMDEAMVLYRNMECEGLSPTVVTHNILLHGLCQLGGLCKSNYVDKALSFFQTMECNGLIPESKTYNIIICGCLWNKKYNEASKLVHKMVDCGFSADAITTSLLQQILTKVQDPTLLAMHQKCLQSGV